MIFDLQNLTFQSGGRPVFSIEKQTIDAGHHLLLLGPSGCGKTTLLNMMAGLLRPETGTLLFQGTDYATLSGSALDKMRAETFGFVFQRLHLLGHLTVAQNIALAQTRAHPARVQALIDDLGLAGQAKQKARDLSVGEAQRVAIARAVANTPQVIFADEPTSALDDANTDKVMDLLFAQAEKTGATVIAATHDARIKNRFDTILEMPL